MSGDSSPKAAKEMPDKSPRWWARRNGASGAQAGPYGERAQIQADGRDYPANEGAVGGAFQRTFGPVPGKYSV
jgi:hypothetical protein